MANDFFVAMGFALLLVQGLMFFYQLRNMQNLAQKPLIVKISMGTMLASVFNLISLQFPVYYYHGVNYNTSWYFLFGLGSIISLYVQFEYSLLVLGEQAWMKRLNNVKRGSHFIEPVLIVFRGVIFLLLTMLVIFSLIGKLDDFFSSFVVIVTLIALVGIAIMISLLGKTLLTFFNSHSHFSPDQVKLIVWLIASFIAFNLILAGPLFDQTPSTRGFNPIISYTLLMGGLTFYYFGKKGILPFSLLDNRNPFEHTKSIEIETAIKNTNPSIKKWFPRIVDLITQKITKSTDSSIISMERPKLESVLIPMSVISYFGKSKSGTNKNTKKFWKLLLFGAAEAYLMGIVAYILTLLANDIYHLDLLENEKMIKVAISLWMQLITVFFLIQNCWILSNKYKKEVQFRYKSSLKSNIVSLYKEMVEGINKRNSESIVSPLIKIMTEYRFVCDLTEEETLLFGYNLLNLGLRSSYLYNSERYQVKSTFKAVLFRNYQQMLFRSGSKGLGSRSMNYFLDSQNHKRQDYRFIRYQQLILEDFEFSKTLLVQSNSLLSILLIFIFAILILPAMAEFVQEGLAGTYIFSLFLVMVSYFLYNSSSSNPSTSNFSNQNDMPARAKTYVPPNFNSSTSSTRGYYSMHRKNLLDQLFAQAPESIEQIQELITSLEQELKFSMSLEDYEDCINILDATDRFYRKAIIMAHDLDLETLIPTLENKISLNWNKQREIKEILWQRQYNLDATKIEDAQKSGNLQLTLNLINFMITRLKTKIKEVQDQITETKNEENNKLPKEKKAALVEDIKKYQQFIDDYNYLKLENECAVNINTINKNIKDLESTFYPQQIILNDTLYFRFESEFERINNLITKISDGFKQYEQLKLKDSTKCDTNFWDSLTSKSQHFQEFLFSFKDGLEQAAIVNGYRFLEQQYNDIITELSKSDSKEDQSSLLQEKKQKISSKIDDFKKTLNTLKINDEKVIPKIQESLADLTRNVQSLDDLISRKTFYNQFLLLQQQFNHIVESMTSDNLSLIQKRNKTIKHDIKIFHKELVEQSKKSREFDDLISALDELIESSDSLKHTVENGLNQLFTSRKEITLKKPTNKVEISIPGFNLKKMDIATQSLPTFTPSLGDSLDLEMHLLTPPKLPKIMVKIPLHAKVVLVGDSSVGKTHLVLSMTDEEYKPTQGSTIGVDKFFKEVSLPYPDYDTQLCFWDLGGQYNYRSLNELFLNDAQIILLVYDVSRRETFDNLTRWIEMVTHTSNAANQTVLIIGNKIDVGGAMIPEEEIQGFLKKYNMPKEHHFLTSALQMNTIKPILENMVGMINWAGLIQHFSSGEMEIIRKFIQTDRLSTPIVMVDEMLDFLQEQMQEVDRLKAVGLLHHAAAQNLLFFGKDERYLIIDPEVISKWMAKIIRLAADEQGKVSLQTLLPKWKFAPEQLTRLMQYLVDENKCFNLGNAWIFPNVHHSKIPPLNENQKRVLEAGTLEANLPLSGPADIMFHKFGIVFSREHCSPTFFSDMAGFWMIGAGKDKTALLAQLLVSQQEMLLRIKVGGGQHQKIMDAAQSLIAHIQDLYD